VNREEALAVTAELEQQGITATIVAFEDGASGVLISTNAGPSVGIDKREDLEVAREWV
jgi:hypothetical protein